MSQLGFDDDGHGHPRDDWTCPLARVMPEAFDASHAEAQRRLHYHTIHHTPETSGRDQLPRDLQVEWKHLIGEAGLAILLNARSYPVSYYDLHWGESGNGARERSRQGNVMPGVSVYVPEDIGGGLIVRGDERRDYPDVLMVLMHVHRFNRDDVYVRAKGCMPAKLATERGSNWGPGGTRLRDPEDMLVPMVNLDAMERWL